MPALLRRVRVGAGDQDEMRRRGGAGDEPLGAGDPPGVAVALGHVRIIPGSEPPPGAGSVIAKAERTAPSMIGCSHRPAAPGCRGGRGRRYCRRRARAVEAPRGRRSSGSPPRRGRRGRRPAGPCRREPSAPAAPRGRRPSPWRAAPRAGRRRCCHARPNWRGRPRPAGSSASTKAAHREPEILDLRRQREADARALGSSPAPALLLGVVPGGQRLVVRDEAEALLRVRRDRRLRGDDVDQRRGVGERAAERRRPCRPDPRPARRGAPRARAIAA